MGRWAAGSLLTGPRCVRDPGHRIWSPMAALFACAPPPAGGRAGMGGDVEGLIDSRWQPRDATPADAPGARHPLPKRSVNHV